MHPLLRILTVISNETTGLLKICVKPSNSYSKERGSSRGNSTVDLILAAYPNLLSPTLLQPRFPLVFAFL